MRILFYLNSMAPAGGIERVIATLANRFCINMEITILVKDDAYSYYELDNRVKLISLKCGVNFNMNSRLSRLLSICKNLWKGHELLKHFLNDNDFDYFYIGHPLNALEFHLAKGISEKVIVTEHGGIDAYNIVYKRLKKWLYPKAKAYVVPTKTDTGLYKMLGFPAIYIPHFKSQLPYSKVELGNNVAITVGRLTEAKRQWILIDLWFKLVYEHKVRDWKLYIVGDGNLKKQYVEKVQDLGLEDYVYILPPVKDVEMYYQKASFFLLTSHSEGFGMVVLEAMSFGLPCISFDCPSGPRDMIMDGINGFLVKFDDVKELEDRTLELIYDKGKRINFGNHAYESSKAWDEEYILHEWLKILN